MASLLNTKGSLIIAKKSKMVLKLGLGGREICAADVRVLQICTRSVPL
jgi:hypothetical protein